MRSISIKLISVFLNTIVPGTGLFALGYNRAAIVVQLVLIFTVSIICWTRMIFTVPGISIMLAVILIVCILSTIACIWLKAQSYYSSRQILLRYTLRVFLFLLLFSSIFITGFIYKDRIFGIHLFFVPSDSMTPTLLPGDFILVDTWLYNSKKPSIDDVVVFTIPGDRRFLVKRISPWPDTIVPTIGGKYYLRGDNQESSRDSFYFGGVEPDRIVGKAKIILFSVNPEFRFIDSRIIKMI